MTERWMGKGPQGRYHGDHGCDRPRQPSPAAAGTRVVTLTLQGRWLGYIEHHRVGL